MKASSPDRGDLIWIDLNGPLGHEQAGTRPVLVLSPRSYNQKVGLALVCPITTREKGYPFEVRLSQVGPIRGVALADHVRSIDWRARRARPAGKASSAVVGEVLGKLAALLTSA